MSDDRERLRERLPFEALRDGIDLGGLREHVDAFYAWAFLPPTYTDDDLAADRGAADTRSTRAGRPDEFDGFDLTKWLAVDTSVGSPAEAVPDETASRTLHTSSEGFGFADWLAAGDRALELREAPASGDGSPTSQSDELPAVLPGVGSNDRPEIHPTMVATVALFLAAATLAVLTVGGVLPPLGPVTGLPA